jgi:hypothetical protein
MAPMTAEELQKHPEYDHTIWDLKPEKKGKVTVANGRGGPIDIAYEVHGKGDRHMVVSPLYIWLHKLQHPPPNQAHTAASFVIHVQFSVSAWRLLSRLGSDSLHVLFQSHGPSHTPLCVSYFCIRKAYLFAGFRDHLFSELSHICSLHMPL